MRSVSGCAEQYEQKFSGITSALLNVSDILPIIPGFLGDCLHLLAQNA